MEFFIIVAVSIIVLWLISLGLLRLDLVRKLTIDIPDFNNKDWKEIRRTCLKYFRSIEKSIKRQIVKTWVFRNKL